MAKIYIDNKEYDIDSSHKNLLDVCLSLGYNLPYFCWHPAMGSVGSCRQCAVKKFQDVDDKKGRIVMACMEPVSDGLRISIEDKEAREFRASIIELLMTNHPHDCPICDEGGECHLQDMTVMTQHTYRRYRFNKRTYKNQYLGPFLNHEMNRCIQCYRCVRFYRDYAGGRDFDVFASRNQVYFGRQAEGILENEFSGNLVEVCPTGVFTDKTLKKHYTRKWDLQNAPSICIHCSLGCNIIAGERYGSLRRILNRYHGKVNGYFICDRGRFGYEYVNGPQRIRQPLRRIQSSGRLEETDALSLLNDLKKGLEKEKKVIGIGSPRASLETNFALRTLVGPENFYNGMSAREAEIISAALNILLSGLNRTPSVRECEKADAVFVIGEDLVNTAPILSLAVRQAAHCQLLERAKNLNIPVWHDYANREIIQHQRRAVYIATTQSTKLDDIALKTYRAAAVDIARLGFAVAHKINSDAPQVPGYDQDMTGLAEEIANTLAAAENPLIIAGSSHGEISTILAAANISRALKSKGKEAQICFVVPECNSIGVSMLTTKNLNQAIETVAQGEVTSVIIAENDLYQRTNRKTIDQLFEKCRRVVVIDHSKNATTEKADIVIPAGTFAESAGTVVNNEGRAQRFYKVYPPQGEIKQSWQWLTDLIQVAAKTPDFEWKNLDGLLNVLVQEFPQFKGIENLYSAIKLPLNNTKIPRQSPRYSGRTSMNANINVSESKPEDDPDAPLSFSMEGYHGDPPSAVIPLNWSPGWNSVQAVNKFQNEIGGSLLDGDPGLRLIEPGNEERSFFTDIPDAFKPRDDQYLVIPLYHIFGSERLSCLSPAIASRSPSPYLMINQQDAKRIGIHGGENADLNIGEMKITLAIKISDTLPKGVCGYPCGLPDIPVFDLPVWGTINKSEI